MLTTKSNPVLAEALTEAGDSDVYGWVMGQWFATASILHNLSPESVPAHWEYSEPIPASFEDYPESYLLETLGLYLTEVDPSQRLWSTQGKPGEVEAIAYLIHAGEVFSRYAFQVKEAGLDY